MKDNSIVHSGEYHALGSQENSKFTNSESGATFTPNKMSSNKKTAGFIMNLLERAHIAYELHTAQSEGDARETVWTHASLSTGTIGARGFFIGIRGARRNGGLYVQDALAKGASVVLIEREYDHLLQHVKRSHVFLGIIVDDAYAAMCAMIRVLREDLRESCTLIGVSGSAGKTTTKNLIWCLLNELAGMDENIETRESSRIDSERTHIVGASTQPVEQPVEQPVAEPMTKLSTEPMTKLSTEPMTKLSTEPMTKPATKLSTEPTTKPATKLSTEPTTKPATKLTAEPMTKPVDKISARAVCSEGNLNTVQGMAMCMLNINWAGVKYGVFECGISEEGEMNELVELLRPDYALLTNVDAVHLQGLKSVENVRKEKLNIAQYIANDGVLWLPEKDERLLAAAHESEHVRCTLKSFSTKHTEIKNMQSDGLKIVCEGIEFALPLVGLVNVENICAAIQVAQYFGMSMEQCRTALKNFENEKSRYQLIRKNPLVIDDSYNASPFAMRQAIAWFAQLKNSPKIIVLAGMRELGAEHARFHREIYDCVQSADIDYVLLHGEEFKIFASDDTARVNFIEKKDEIYTRLQQILSTIAREEESTGSVALLFKGSRYYELDTIARLFV